MPNKSDRRKLRGFRKTSKETKMIVRKKKHAKLECALCESPLHGVPHGDTQSKRGKKSKTERRPTGIFGGILCANCRALVFLEAAKIKSGMKDARSMDLALKPYIIQIEKKVDAYA